MSEKWFLGSAASFKISEFLPKCPSTRDVTTELWMQVEHQI